jgi:hypothetical protein
MSSRFESSLLVGRYRAEVNDTTAAITQIPIKVIPIILLLFRLFDTIFAISVFDLMYFVLFTYQFNI